MRRTPPFQEWLLVILFAVIRSVPGEEISPGQPGLSGAPAEKPESGEVGEKKTPAPGEEEDVTGADAQEADPAEEKDAGETDPGEGEPAETGEKAGDAAMEGEEKKIAPEEEKEDAGEKARKERLETLGKSIAALIEETGMEPDRRKQLGAMMMAAYRDSPDDPLWPGDLALEEVFQSLRSLLTLHGFEETELSFPAKTDEEPAGEETPDVEPLPEKDLLITLGLGETCLRLKMGPASAAEWPNWTYGDTPVARSSAHHWDEVAKRFGETSAGAEDPLSVAEQFIPRNWVYQGIHREIRRALVAPKPPQIEVEGLIKVGNEFSQAELLAFYLGEAGFLPEEDLEGITGVYSESLSEAVRAFQKDQGLQSDGILGPKTAERISRKNEMELEQLYLNLHRARRLPDDMGERHLVANLPAGEVYGMENGEEGIRMRIVFGKNIAGQRTPVFRDQMEKIVFRPYWNIPYSIAVSESPYSDLAYLTNNGFEIVSSSSGRILPLTNGSLIQVRERSAYIRQNAGHNNALGLVKFLFPNKHAVYFHDTPHKHYFKNEVRTQSHGCVRLQEPEAMANWVLKNDGQWDSGKIGRALHQGSRQEVDLAVPIPVYLVYFTAFPDPKGDEGVRFYRDCYRYDVPNAVIDAPGPKPRAIEIEEERRGFFHYFRQMNENPRRSNSSRKGGGLFRRNR